MSIKTPEELLNVLGSPNFSSTDLAEAMGYIQNSVDVSAIVEYKDQHNMTALAYAASIGDLKLVELLLNNGAELNVQNSFGYTAAMLATAQGQTKIAKLLINKGADITLKSIENKNLLDLAIEDKNRLIQKSLKKKRVIIDKVFHQKSFLNTYNKLLGSEGVCSGFNLEITRWALKHIDQGEKEGEINIIAKLNSVLSSKKGKNNFAKRLQLYQSEQISTVSPPLDISYQKNNFFDSLPDAIKNQKFIGFSFNCFDDNGQWYGAHTINIRKIGDSQSYEVIDVNLGSRKCKNKDMLNKHIEDILHHYNNTDEQRVRNISVYNIEEIVRKRDLLPEPLLKNDSPDEISRKKINNKEKKYKLAGSILTAIQSNTPIDFIRELIIKEDVENINYQNEYGCTALMYAIGNTEIVKLLIEKSANLNIQDKDGEDALIYSIDEGNKKTAKLLIKKGADITSLYGDDKHTALMHAIDGDETEIAKLLIKKGADLNIKDEDGRSALIYAANKGNTEITKLLIEKGVNLNTQDENGKTALMHALEHNRMDIAKNLIAADINLNLQDNKGKTALIYCIDGANTEMAQLLINKGADLEMKNKQGRTALDYAKSTFSDEKLIALLKHSRIPVNAYSFILGEVSEVQDLPKAPSISARVLPSPVLNKGSRNI